MSLEVKDLGDGLYEIACGDQRVRVAGVVGKVTAKAKTVEVSTKSAEEIFPYYTIPVGPISKGKSRFSVMVPALPGLLQEDLGEIVLHLQEHPKWLEVESKIAAMPKSAPMMILGKKIR